MLDDFCKPGKMDFILGGQYGSEGKGAASAWLTTTLNKRREDSEAIWAKANRANHEFLPYAASPRGYDVVTTNAGCQSGHTSIYNGVKRVLFHFPTAGVLDPGALIYLNAGAVIDPDMLLQEIRDNDINLYRFCIHPNAAIVTPECREAEGRADSAQTRIASTRKGVGEAISHKVLRSATLASKYDWGRHGFVPHIRAMDLNYTLRSGGSVLCEIPQGLSLSLNSSFYPHVTSRDCTIGQAMSDAGVHPSFMGSTMLVMRTFPIRVGNIESKELIPGVRGYGHSGTCYPDQQETSWEALGVKPEITTVTKRVRRVFTWSRLQLNDAMNQCRPELVYLTFCDYPADLIKIRNDIHEAAYVLGLKSPPQIMYQSGPSTDDVKDWF